MGYVLIKYELNWADEMDVNGFEVMTEEKLAEYINKVEFGDPENDIEPTEFPYECYIGSNQSITIDSLEEFKDMMKGEPVTDEEYAVLSKFFCKYGRYVEFGTTIDVE